LALLATGLDGAKSLGSVDANPNKPGVKDAVMPAATSPLLTDLYQLNMMQACLDHGDTDTAVFELFVRSQAARVAARRRTGEGAHSRGYAILRRRYRSAEEHRAIQQKPT
jgi:hypothetical protein